MRRIWMLMTLLSVGPIQAQDLCGSADQLVCLQSSVNLSLNGVSAVLEGTVVVLLVPGVTLDGGGTVTGAPTVPYRFADEGSLDDHQDGLWTRHALAEDARGITALGFAFESTAIVAPITLTINDYKVCQRVADGPGPVLLAFQLLLVGGKKVDVMALGKQRLVDFETCAATAGNMPLSKSGTRAVLANVYQTPVAVYLENSTTTLEPGQQMTLVGATTPSPFGIASSLPLPMVLSSELEDIDMVGMSTANHTHFVVPHLASDTQSWVNRFAFANGQATTVQWRQGATPQNFSYGVGARELEIASANPPEREWAFVSASRPINCFSLFARRDGNLGAAWVEALRTDASGAVTATTLYLPHVAADRASFWTGYSLANPHDTAVQVNMDGFDANGTLLTVESFTIPAFGKETGVVGETRLVGQNTVAWVRFRADQGLAGLELVGGRHEERPYLAGFLLPDQGHDAFAFPLLRTVNGFWSGLALLNPGNSASNGMITWKNSAGTVLGMTALQLAARQKHVMVAPAGSSQAVVEGDGLIGFVLVGELNSDRLGAYGGLPFTNP